MTQTNKRSLTSKLASVVSTVLQPLMMPLYTLLIMFYANSFMANFLPVQAKIYLIVVVLVCTLIIPAIFLILLNAVGALESLQMNNRKERVVPLIVIFMTYSFCALLVSRSSVDLAFLSVMAALSCITFALIVTPFWKISLHMIGIGGVYAMLLFVGMAEHSDFTWAMILATLLAGALAWARLHLGRHTPMQVAAGFLGGVAAASLTILFL